MPRREVGGFGAWLKNQFWNTSLPWLLGCVVAGAIFYSDTAKTQLLHSQVLDRLEKAVQNTKIEEAAERAKIREQFLVNSKEMSSGIAELNKQTAITSTILAGLAREVEKLGTKLDAQQPKLR